MDSLFYVCFALRMSMSIAFWLVFVCVSALHVHNYRLLKLIISSRLMCWRLFVYTLFFSHCGQSESCALCQFSIRYRFTKINKNRTSRRKKSATRTAMKNEWMYKIGMASARTYKIKRIKLKQRQMHRTHKRSINFWINSCSQRRCMLNNNLRAKYEQIPCNKIEIYWPENVNKTKKAADNNSKRQNFFFWAEH